MSDNYHYYEPCNGHGLAHDPFNAIIAPRPIGWIASQDNAGQVNLAPYSFFNAFNYVPPIIGFASVGYKDSVRNIEQTGEFCWNLVSEPLMEKMNQTSASVEQDVDEFDVGKLKKAPSRCVAVPHVAESPVIMECKKTQIVRLKDKAQQEVDTWMVFGEVVAVHINKAMIEDGVYQTVAGQPVLRGGGTGDYFTIDESGKRIMPRPG